MYFIPPPIAKLNTCMVPWEVNSTHKKCSLTVVAWPLYNDFKMYPNLYALLSPIIITAITQHTKFPPTAATPGKPAYHAIHCPTAKFGPLSMGSITNPMFIMEFDAHLTPRSLGSWWQGWVPTPSQAPIGVWFEPRSFQFWM